MNINNAIQLAFEYYQAGNLKEAEHIYKKILKKQPKHLDALHFLGIICYQLGNYDLAINYINKALQLNPKNADAYNNLGLALRGKGNLDEAIIYFQKAVQLNPIFTYAYNNLGVALKEKGELDESINCFQKALQLNPSLANTYYNLGLSLQGKGQLDEAMNCYQKALQLNPNLADTYNTIGTILQGEKQFDEAINCYQKALQLNPNLADAYNNIGTVLQEKEQFDEAINCYQKALQLNSNLADAYNNIGTILQGKGQLDEAIAYCRKALEVNPDLTLAYCQFTYLMQQTCTWQEFEVMTPKLDGLTRKALDTGSKPAEPPIMSIIRHADPPINFAIAKSWSHDIVRAMSNSQIHFSFVERTDKTEIVIGYLSNDFRNHATAHLMLSLFGLHNRAEFEIFCYSYGKDDGSYYRTRIQHDCDKFVDISNLSDYAAARCIYEDQVDILVDLKGYIKGARLGICVLRPAPIQVSYLGFPGTTGADFFDYIISDKIVTPKDDNLYYTEKFVYMPHCYQVNDHAQPISNKEWTKVDFALPESSFVFCSFNQPYKIDPVIFDIWMRILHRVPQGVLWLGCRDEIVEKNLRREAEARGVQSGRLIFAEKLPKDEHLARLRFADLALDTRIVNGHTTTSDALWAGVPVITLQGSHFASRVSSSILSALGVPELITHSIEEYESLAVRLALNALELKEIRQRIARNRIVEPLFDTPRFVKNLETAYKEMWKIFLAGNAPQQIEVLES